jgi:hypothetical protein
VIRLKADEWRVLSLLDEERKVSDLVDISGCSRFGVIKVLYAMLSVGFVEHVQMPGADSRPADANTYSASALQQRSRKGGLLSFFRR